MGNIAAVAVTVATLSGCMGGGLDFAGTPGIDKSLSTGSIPRTSAAEANPDAAAVRNTVSSAKVGTTLVPWANAESGSAGVISMIEEEEVDGRTCRRFTTTRHSYQGIAKFDGTVCRLAKGEWSLTSFAPRS